MKYCSIPVFAKREQSSGIVMFEHKIELKHYSTIWFIFKRTKL